MTRIQRGWAVVICMAVVQIIGAQAPLLHYTFSEGGAPASTENTGTFSPGLSPLIGHTLTGTSPNGTHCLTGVAGAANEVTTPLNVAFGNTSWTVGFCINNSANPGGFNYVFSDDQAAGWRVFTNGAAGAGNIRMTGGTVPTIDIVGGAGDTGFVHLAWVHDTAANLIHAYLNGALVSSTAAAAVNLNSGLPIRIGRNGATSLQTGTLIDDFRFFDRTLTTADVAAWSASCLSALPDFTKVMITEVSWGDPDGLEITNFDTGTIALTNWTVKWRDSSGTSTSTPINVSILSGESIIVGESAAFPGIPPGTQALVRFGTLPTTSSALTVALLDNIGTPVDEVRISDTAGAHPGWSFGGTFRGLAIRGVVSGTNGEVGVERIWGLDSNSGTDWTEQPNRSFGRENRSSGPRGTDTVPVLAVRINEIDDNPDYIELHNAAAFIVDVSNWVLLCSSAQGNAHAILTIPAGTVIPAGGFVVLGDTATPPAEIPGGVSYVVIGAIPWVSSELDCALYDNLGRLVDLVRAPRANSQLVHNLPRAPSYWSDFVGAAGRNLNGGDDAFGRNSAGTDTNSGADFFPMFTRTMGSANPATAQAGPAGHGDALDVRLNETAAGQGFQAIINAGPASSGLTYNFFVSTPHSAGIGPFFGLGGDALANFPAFYNVPPFSGLLDAQGSARIDFNPGSIPAGIDADFIFFLQNPAHALVSRTLVIEFDS